MYRKFLPVRKLARALAQPAPRFASTAASTAYTQVTHKLESIPPELQKIIDLAKENVLPVYARPEDIVISHADGSNMYALGGLKFLDFSAGIAVNAIGHADKAYLEELGRLAREVMHSSNVYHNKYSAKLAGLLVELTKREGGLGWAPGSTQGGAKVFFSNTGTEANEGALKVVRMTGKHRWAEKTGESWDTPGCPKYRIVCFQRGFHGRSMGALSVTTKHKYQAPFEPLLPGVEVGRLNDFEGLEKLITDLTCGVIVEPIQGEGGVHESHEDWLRALRKRCDETGAVLIFDEIQCGLYRTGELWAHSKLKTDCHPDIITMAKPLANGYPIGAVVMRDSVAQYMTAGTHGTTFGGSPLACGLGHHVLSRLSQEGFRENIRETGRELDERLRRLPEWFPRLVKEIRGRGLIKGIGFHDGGDAVRLVEMARERGVLLLTGGDDAVRLVPSLNVRREDLDLALNVIESCLGVMAG